MPPTRIRTRFRLLTLFGLGYLPVSGTWGSAPTVILAALLIGLGLGPAHHPIVYNTILLAVFFTACGICIAFGDHAEARYRRKDPPQVVADEAAAQCMPLLFLPAASVATPGVAAFTLVFAFVAFRVLDIFKPWPADNFQSYPSGWGVLLDDIVAGAYAMVIVQVAARTML